MSQLFEVIKKDLKIEFRQKSSINGMLLYVITTVFIAYMVFQIIEDLSTWIALFWIIMVFAATNASTNLFKYESNRQYLYYYGLIPARLIMLSKLSVNSLIITTVTLINYLFFTILVGNPIENYGLFLLVLLLGALGMASVFTLISGIASKTNNNSALTALLGFPVLLPLILTGTKASMLCGLGFGWEECGLYIGVLALINLIVLALSLVLFPYLWRS